MFILFNRWTYTACSSINPFMPTVAFNICCPRDCVSRHNWGTAGASLKPLRDDSAQLCCCCDNNKTIAQLWREPTEIWPSFFLQMSGYFAAIQWMNVIYYQSNSIKPILQNKNKVYSKPRVETALQVMVWQLFFIWEILLFRLKFHSFRPKIFRDKK